MYQGMNLDEQDEPVMMVWARVASYQTNIDLNTRDQLIWTNLYFVLHHKYPSQELTPSYPPAVVLRPPLEDRNAPVEEAMSDSRIQTCFDFQFSVLNKP